MSSDRIIAKLPPSKWQPIIEVLAEAIQLVDNQEFSDFALVFKITGYSTEPYLQVSLNEVGDYVFEITSSNFLKPGLNNIQTRTIESVGWMPPGSSNPNYSKVFDRNYSPISIATYSLTVFRMTFEVSTETLLHFSPVELTALVEKRSEFEIDDQKRFRLKPLSD